MNGKKDNFAKFIGLSIAFHVAVVTVLSVRVFFFPGERPDLNKAVRVDVVALPDKQVGPAPVIKKDKPKPAPKKPKPKPKAKPKKAKPKKKAPPKVNLKKKKQIKKQQNKALDAIAKRIKQKKQAEEQAAQQFKNNQLSQGNSPTGLKKLKWNAYNGELDSHIRQHWNLPEWLANGNFNAHVVVKIGRNGAVLSTQFSKSSGNELFDQQVLATIEKANPMPAPPPDLQDWYSREGVELRFPE